jgi:hypothetical protein
MNLSYPDEPGGNGAFDQWELDYCDVCHEPYEYCICSMSIEDIEEMERAKIREKNRMKNHNKTLQK